MNCKSIYAASIVAMVVLSSLTLYVSTDSDAELSISDWAEYDPDVSNRYYNADSFAMILTDAVEISSLDTRIQLPSGTLTKFTASALGYSKQAQGYMASGDNKTNTLPENATFADFSSLFTKIGDKSYLDLFVNMGGTFYEMIVCYDGPFVSKYDVTGTLTAGTSDVSISATAKMAADANVKLSTPMFYVIAHYNDGKFISSYISVTADKDGTLTLVNTGVSKTGLVDVMVGVVGAVPSDDPTVYYGESILTLATA